MSNMGDIPSHRRRLLRYDSKNAAIFLETESSRLLSRKACVERLLRAQSGQ